MKNKKSMVLLAISCGLFATMTQLVKAQERMTVGDFQVEGGRLNTDYRYQSGVLTILTNRSLTIKNTNPQNPTTNRIVILENVNANLIFAGINIETASNDNSPFTLTPDSNGDGRGAIAHITLADKTDNILKSNAKHYPGLRCGTTTTLYIDDAIVNKDNNGKDIIPKLGRIPSDLTLLNGTKVKKGDRLTLLDSRFAGTLTVTGYNNAAGIGGGNGENGGNININGGIISATAKGTNSNKAHSGAGIGGGHRGSGGNITINGGIITANGAYHGAGVGGGYHTKSSNDPVVISPKAVDFDTGNGKSGNITINGGLTYSKGGTHGDAFGDGCSGYTNKMRYKIIMTGGTVIPTAGTVGDRYDLGGSQADVFVLGGSLKADKFRSIQGEVAYGDMQKKTEVFMSKISLNSWGDDKVGTTLVDDMEMKINGITYNYGIPSYTDAQGILYFWLPDTNKGAEVSVDLDILDKMSGEILNTDTFFAKNVGNGGNIFLKQYINFEINNADLTSSLITKRYDGKGLNDEQIKKAVAALRIPTTIPSGGVLNIASKLVINSQLLKEDGETPEENAEIVPGSSTGAGKYQLIITSTQYADSSIQNFSDAYWGHRTYFKYAEITPANTEAKLTVGGLSEPPNVIKPEQTITLNANISPAKGEGLDCASPKGYVQFYINGNKYGAPVLLVTHNKDASSKYNYSTASIDWKAINSDICVEGSEQKISIEYLGEDRNYTKGSKDDKILKMNDLNIDVDGDGIPDINIDTDKDGKPDINIDPEHDWKPNINIDTDNTGTWKPSSQGGNADGIWKPDTNIDIKGDGNANEDYYRPAIDVDGDGVDDNWKPSINVDYGKTDFEYDTGNPNINIDTNGDGKPDTNIDTNGDGTPDTNIDINNDNIPDINIDTNEDGKPDINVDTNGDKVPDINIDIDGDGKPDIDIDTNGDAIPDTNIDTNGDQKPDINIDTDGDEIPDINVDIDGDQKPDINIDTNEDGIPDINVDIDGDQKPDVNVDTDGDKKPDINVDVDGDKVPDINIDTNEDGIPDINVDIDGDQKPDINIDTNEDGKPDINVDTDGDKKPDINIDTNQDGKPDINVDIDGDKKPDINIDTNEDEKPDINVDTNGDKIPDINIDTDKDGKPDINIDTDGDSIPDINIDIDGDKKPDINIDSDLDKLPDINIDINEDKKPDINIDTDNTGIWKPSTEGGNEDGIWKPDTNIDTNGDGKGDSNSYQPPIDVNEDGVDDYWNPDTVVKLDGLKYDTGNPIIRMEVNNNKTSPIKTNDTTQVSMYALLLVGSALSIIYIIKRNMKHL